MLHGVTFKCYKVTFCYMGSVIRLKDDVTLMLQPYSSDPNEAIRKVFVTLEATKVALEAVKSINSASNCDRNRVLVSDFSPVSSINGVATTREERIQQAKAAFSSTPVPDSGVPAMFNEAFWKKLREEVTKSLEPMVGHGV